MSDIDTRGEGVAEEGTSEVDEGATQEAGARLVVVTDGGGGFDVGEVVHEGDEPHGDHDGEAPPKRRVEKGLEEGDARHREGEGAERIVDPILLPPRGLEPVIAKPRLSDGDQPADGDRKHSTGHLEGELHLNQEGRAARRLERMGR